MIKLTSAKGLGDAIYLRAIVLHLLERGETPIAVFTFWPAAFADLPILVRSPDEQTGTEGLIQASYLLRDHTTGDQFTMACERAGLDPIPPLVMNWRVCNPALVEAVRVAAQGRGIFMFQPPKLVNNAEQEELRPSRSAFERYVDEWRGHFRIKVGHPAFTEEGNAPCELDLYGKTSIHDVFDLGTIAAMCFGESSFLLIMAEAMDRPFTCMFTRRGLDSDYERVRNVRPDRIFHKQHLASVVYDETVAFETTLEYQRVGAVKGIIKSA